MLNRTTQAWRTINRGYITLVDDSTITNAIRDLPGHFSVPTVIELLERARLITIED